MARFSLFVLILLAGLAVLALALVAPVHFRATDARVVAAAQASGLSLSDAGIALARQGKIGAAQMFLALGQKHRLAGASALQLALETQTNAQPAWAHLGGPDPLAEAIFTGPSAAGPRSAFDLLLVDEMRGAALNRLYASTRPSVRRLLATRALTNLTQFSPVNTPAGKPLDAAIALTALLAQGDHFAPTLRDHLEWLAKEAHWGGQAQNLERVYLDLLALGKRLNWGQLTEFLRPVPDAPTLHTLTEYALEDESRLPALFAAVQLSGEPDAVARWLNLKHTRTTALADLEFSVRYGQGGLGVLLDGKKRLYHPRERLIARLHLDRVSAAATKLALDGRWLVLALKILLLFDGAYLLALAGTYLLPAELSGRRLVSPAQVALTAALLALVLVWTEPFVLQQARPVEMPLHWKMPMVEGPLRTAIQKHMSPITVDALSIISLTFWLLVQVAIFTYCRRKLAEIQRQSLPSKLKLKLLENEEHLFDAGLYCGFVGTVLSLVALSIGLLKPASLMAAYSATSFGIIFVMVLKVFYVRPYRRQLIMEADADAEAAAAQAAATLAQ